VASEELHMVNTEVGRQEVNLLEVVVKCVEISVVEEEVSLEVEEEISEVVEEMMKKDILRVQDNTMKTLAKDQEAVNELLLVVCEKVQGWDLIKIEISIGIVTKTNTDHSEETGEEAEAAVKEEEAEAEKTSIHMTETKTMNNQEENTTYIEEHAVDSLMVKTTIDRRFQIVFKSLFVNKTT